MNYPTLIACCPIINVIYSGDIFKYGESLGKIFRMHPGFSNGHRYWTSSEGYAIWYHGEFNGWIIGPSKVIGVTDIDFESNSIWKKHSKSQSIGKSGGLNINPNKECPYDDLKSNWKYWNGEENSADVFDSVRLHCLKGKMKLILEFL